MFTHRPSKLFIVSLLCALASASFVAGTPTKLSAPDTVVVALPPNNISLGVSIELGFDDPPLSKDYFGLWHNTSVSIQFPNGTIQPCLWTSNADCIGRSNTIDSGTPIQYTCNTYPTTDAGVYVILSS